MRRSIPKIVAWVVNQRDNFTCQYCGKRADQIFKTIRYGYHGFERTDIPQIKGDYSHDPYHYPFEFDHVVPVSKSGTNNHRNIVLACRRCNRAKKDLSPSEFINAMV